MKEGGITGWIRNFIRRLLRGRGKGEGISLCCLF
jgi:hypothetical protein